MTAPQGAPRRERIIMRLLALKLMELGDVPDPRLVPDEPANLREMMVAAAPKVFIAPARDLTDAEARAAVDAYLARTLPPHETTD